MFSLGMRPERLFRPPPGKGAGLQASKLRGRWVRKPAAEATWQGGSRLPASLETVENKLHYIHMKGREVFKFAVRVLVEILRKYFPPGDSAKGTWTFYPLTRPIPDH